MNPAPVDVPACVREVIDSSLGRAHRPDPITPNTGGPAGNARLTAATGLLLLAMFFIEGLTVLAIGPLITWHIIVGFLLIPPVLLKTATTTYRIVGYYARRPLYRQAGPPPVLLRVLGPAVIALTLALLGTGVALIATGPSGARPFVIVGPAAISLVTLHQASAIAWLAVIGAHVLTRTVSALRLTASDGRPRPTVPGRNLRLLVVLLALAAASGTGALLANWGGGAWQRYVHGEAPAAKADHSSLPAGGTPSVWPPLAAGELRASR